MQPDATGAKPRQYRFQLTPADVIAYEVRTQVLDWRIKLMLLLLVSIAGLVLSALTASIPAWLWWSLAALAAIAALAAAVIYPNIQLRRRAAAYRLPVGDTVVTIERDAVTESAEGRTRRVSWRAIKSIAEGPGHLFLTTQEGPIILPYGAFDDEADFLATSEAIREAVFRAKPAQTKPAGQSGG